MHSRPRCAIAAIGSHDLILGMTASALRADDPLITLASFNVGWLSGWWRCATDCATSPASGGGGAGTRALLDHDLAQRRTDLATVSGYSREEHTHLAVAAAVAAGRPETGLGILARRPRVRPRLRTHRQGALRPGAANEHAREQASGAGVGAARARGLPGRVEALGGYSCAETGHRIRSRRPARTVPLARRLGVFPRIHLLRAPPPLPSKRILYTVRAASSFRR